MLDCYDFCSSHLLDLQTLKWFSGWEWWIWFKRARWSCNLPGMQRSLLNVQIISRVFEGLNELRGDLTWIQAQLWGSQAHGSSRVSSPHTAAWENVSLFLCSAFFFFSSTLLSAVRALFPLAREHVASSSKGFRACHWQKTEQAFSPCFENSLLLVDRACKSFLMCWRKCYFFFLLIWLQFKIIFHAFPFLLKAPKSQLWP